MNTTQLARLLVAAAATLFLAACGGGSSSPTTATPNPTPDSVAFVAFGSSASTTSLGWQPPGGSATYAIERSNAGGDWVAVVGVDARSGSHLDSGLAAVTDYRYRLVEVGATRRTLAERSAKTSDELPVTSAPGTALGDAVTQTFGAAGGQVVSPDGAFVVKVAAGAFAADVGTTVQAVSNTAFDGRGNGLRIQFGTTPAAPLTLTLRYAAAEDGEADAQRIAVQRGDGSWVSLPLAARDKAARTLTAELAPSLFAAPASARAAAATALGEFIVVRYLAFFLKPPQAQVEVKKSLGLVPYARVSGTTSQDSSCQVYEDGFELCPLVPKPVLKTREIPFLNSKAGFDRHWTVAGIEGGNATFGTVAPNGSIGATFTAPDNVPDPSTVTVSLQSRHSASGRTVTLSSQIKITDGRWTGTMSAETAPSDAGTSFVAIARAT